MQTARDQLLGALDLLVPADIRDFQHDEELIRARALVFIITLAALATIPLVPFLFVDNPPPFIPPVLPPVSTIGLIGYVIALWIFRRTGLFIVSGNLYALIGSATILMIAITSDSRIYLIMGMLSLPVVVSLIANHASAMMWLTLTLFAPEIVKFFGGKDLGIFFTNSWTGICLGLFFAMHLEYLYRENMRRRLHIERSHFEFAAAHDPLTGLANRATFERRLGECIETCALHRASAALLYIDLDRFKSVNDTCGHRAGDRVLSCVADRMRSLVRSSDTVARIGGDEFAILLEKCDPGRVDDIIERLHRMIEEPIEAFGHRMSVQCSIGKVVYPEDGRDPDQLMHKADERMYDGKRLRSDGPSGKSGD